MGFNSGFKGSNVQKLYYMNCRSQWPRGLRHRSAAAGLLRSWVRIPPGAWMFVFCECCVLEVRGFCDELITRPEKSYRLCCVVVCDLETWRMRRPWSTLGRSATAKKGRKNIIYDRAQLRSEPNVLVILNCFISTRFQFLTAVLLTSGYSGLYTA